MISNAANLCEYEKEAKNVLIDLANGREVSEDSFLLWVDYMIDCGYASKYQEDFWSIVSQFIFAKD